MTMRINKGNLLDAAVRGDVPIVMHGANCFHTFGSGIAGEAARRFPEIPEADRTTGHGNPMKLGDYSLAKVTYEVLPVDPKGKPWQDKLAKNEVILDNPFTCINLYTQFKPGKDFIESIFPSALHQLVLIFCSKIDSIFILL